jgi:menaquinone-specific isochorismate synthase
MSSFRLISVSQPAPGLTPLDFVRHAQGQPRFYWNDHDPITFAGMGVAAELFAWGAHRFEQIASQAQALFEGAVVEIAEGGGDTAEQPLAVPRLFGGFAFRDDFMPDNTWATFHPAHFVLPHYQLLAEGREAWLTINAQIPWEEDPAEILPALREALAEKVAELQNQPSAPLHAHPAGTPHISYPMTEAEWTRLVGEATAEIGAGTFQKVVLARLVEVLLPQPVAISRVLAYLDTQYADCYRFLFEPQPHHAFYGATPELLTRVTGTAVQTMGMAGSIRRGNTPGEDNALAMALRHSEKDRHEHQLVVDSIQRRLVPLTTELEVPTRPQIYTLSNIHHLYTPIAGTLAEPCGVLPIVATLHPTPALGGTPRAAAMQFIQTAEPVSRGWYAAPVGWIDHRLDGVFAVAIRSAVAQQNRVWAYAGAGIVAQSVPETEWQETQVKLRPMLNALGV